MNFSFGAQPITKPSEGFTLGTPTNTTAGQPGINFAAGDNKGLQTPQSAPKFNLSTATLSGGLSGGISGGLSGGLSGAPANTSTDFGGFNVLPRSTAAQPLLGTPTNKTLGLGAPTSTAVAQPNFSSGSNISNIGALSSAPLLFSNSPKTTAPSLGSNLGLPAATAASTPTFNLGSTLGATTPAASTGFTLGGVSSAGLTPAVSTSTSTSTFSLGSTPAATTSTSTGLTSVASTALTSTISTTTPAQPAGTFTFGQLEEALNKWTLELEDQGKMFINQALQLNAWDRLVIANGDKILTLNNGIEKVKQQQLQLDHELDFVLAQQRELEECIAPLEKELKDTPITDQDRNHTYQIAENMDTQLKQMSEDLKEIIEHLNESNKTEETNDPVAQIGRILNAHMNSLQWIDRNTAQISTYLDQITKMHDMHRRDNERSFHLTYE